MLIRLSEHVLIGARKEGQMGESLSLIVAGVGLTFVATGVPRDDPMSRRSVGLCLGGFLLGRGLAMLAMAVGG